MIRRRLAVLVAALAVLLVLNPGTVLALSYTGNCSTQNHISAHIDRGGGNHYLLVRSTVVAKGIQPCYGSGGVTMVLPANISSSQMLAQLGYGSLASGDPADFIWTPSDHSSPLGIVTHVSFAPVTFAWNHTYEFEIYEDTSQWGYRVWDKTAGISQTKFQARSDFGDALWWGVESYNSWDVFGGFGTGGETSLTTLQYVKAADPADTWTVTGDTAPNWGCVGCTPPNSYFKATVTSPVGSNDQLNAWTYAH